MANPKKGEIENRLTGEKATIMRDRRNHRTLIMKLASAPAEPPTPSTVPTEKPKAEKAKTKPKAESAKTEKTEKVVKSTKPALKEIEQKVLDFLTSLDHPATSIEVRDQFNFPLRAPARAIFRKLEKLGYGENRKVGNRYLFYVKGKVYLPKAEPPKVEEKGGEAKETK